MSRDVKRGFEPGHYARKRLISIKKEQKSPDFAEMPNKTNKNRAKRVKSREIRSIIEKSDL